MSGWFVVFSMRVAFSFITTVAVILYCYTITYQFLQILSLLHGAISISFFTHCFVITNMFYGLQDLSAKVSFEAPVQQRSQGASKVRCGMAQYLMVPYT